MDGAAVWTELGDERGLDPLGLLAPIEASYQSLLPGFSSVTTRLRYYSFHCWWLAAYARSNPSDQIEHYRLRARRSEALFALASLFAPNAPSQHNGELGLAGSNFARDKLASPEDPLDFVAETEPWRPGCPTYLKARGGAFAQVYAPQMVEIGLLHRGRYHGWPVPTDLGLALADRFEGSLNGEGPLFLQAAERGKVSRDELARLASVRPGALDPVGAEAEALRKLLLARGTSDPRHIRRRGTLTAILKLAESAGSGGIDPDSLRWHWMEAEPSPTDPLREIHESWRHYQTGDTLRVAYDALLRLALRRMTEADAPRTLPRLAEDIASVLPDHRFDILLEDLATDPSGLRDLLNRALLREADLLDILKPIARVWGTWLHRLDALRASYRTGGDAHTVLDELLWIRSMEARHARSAAASLLLERILRRHLWVATRKLRFQQSYTFLFEVDDAEVRYRDLPEVGPSGPRLITALQFLTDVGLLSSGRITDLGRAELAGL